jgi:hypothetical protein
MGVGKDIIGLVAGDAEAARWETESASASSTTADTTSPVPPSPAAVATGP